MALINRSYFLNSFTIILFDNAITITDLHYQTASSFLEALDDGSVSVYFKIERYVSEC